MLSVIYKHHIQSVSHHFYTNNKEFTQLSFYITCWMMFTFLASAIRFISFLTLSMSTPLFLLLQPKCSSFLNTIPKSNIHVHLDVWDCSIWVNITQIQCSYTQALEHQKTCTYFSKNDAFKHAELENIFKTSLKKKWNMDINQRPKWSLNMQYMYMFQ